MIRQQRTLNGTWQFQLDPDGALAPATLAPDREITVPLPWQVPFPELERYSGYAWYRRTFTLDQPELNGQILLRFGAVDYWCEVFVNGHKVGEHEGGYTAFTLPIAAAARAGNNELAVWVYDTVQTGIEIPRWPSDALPEPVTAPPFNARDIPHGKQTWYYDASGIWQDVTLTIVPRTYIDLLHVTPNIHTGAAQIVIEIAGAEANGELDVAITQDGSSFGDARVALVAGQTRYEAQITVAQPELWNIDTPTLYTATARLHTASGDDEHGARFGFREIATRYGRLLLNGEPLFLLSALDQDLYADTIYTVPSDAYLRDQFRKAKELGLNNLRCHIKPPDPRYLDIADEMGLLVWAEIPSWRTFGPRQTVHRAMTYLGDDIKQRVERTLEEMVQRDYNHPSLIVWTIVNEDWGTSLPLSADDRAWVAQMYQRCKQLDPTRLVVDNSACGHAWGPNIHVHSDLDDYHVYTNIPDAADQWEHMIEAFANRAAWTYSQHGDATRTGGEPLILSEFGNWGLPSVEALRKYYGGDPNWFEIGAWWSPWEGEPGWARGVVERFSELGLDAIWPDYETFATATQWHQFNAMKFEIEVMRRQPNLAGYVITEFSDIYWESNGLLDFTRGEKAYHHDFAMINTPDVVVPEPERYASWDDQKLAVRLHVSHYSGAIWADATLRWQLGAASGEQPVAAVARASVATLGVERLAVPQVEAAQTARVEFTLSGAHGTLAHNRIDVLVLPAAQRTAHYSAPIAVIGKSDVFSAFTDDTAAQASAAQTTTATSEASTELALGTLTQRLARLGYQATSRISADTQLAVTNAPDAATLQWVRDGGSLLFLCHGASPFFYAQGRGGAYGGNWMSGWSWLRPGVYQRLAGAENPLGLPFRNIAPRYAIVGLPVEDAAVQPDFLAGMVVGWVRHPALHTVQFRYGAGRVVMTTFALEQGLRNDPVAIAMLHDLIDHLGSDACAPTLRAL